MERDIPILDMSCRHGDVVEVIPRSLEVEPCLDLVINGDDGDTAHLSYKQTIRLRDALDQFIVAAAVENLYG